jgi:hypothetical protein
MARDMTSVLEKVELLKSVGAEELADQVLLKVIQLETDRLQQEQQRLQEELKRFESQYRMSSEICQKRFEMGELGDAVDFFEWTSVYDIYQRNAQTLRRLEEQRR